MAETQSRRRMGREMRAAVWAGRHPGVLGTPTAIAASGHYLGWDTTAGVLGGAAALAGGWYRAHPDSFDRVAGPLVRSQARRWTVYHGWRWQRVMQACELYTTARKTGEDLYPRVIKVRAYSPSIDVVYVRLRPGQHAGWMEQKLPQLAETLRAERVAIERVKPGVVGLIVQRSEPFTEVIDAPEMPWDSAAVDLTDLYLGEDEYGGQWRGSLLGHHWLGAGATGAGKNSVPMAMLRAAAPLLRDGLVRLWLCDPKQMEFARLAPIAHRYASAETDCVDLVAEYVEDMRRVQQQCAANGQRRIEVSRQTPLNLLVLDELGTLLAYGDFGAARELRKSLSLAGSQGRATGHSMFGLVQEPTKDTVPVRELFTDRFCLRVTSASHVDMTLGDGARLRGALADEIPNAPETAGIGYVVRPRSRVPMRVRAAYTSDADVDALVDFVQTGWFNSDTGESAEAA